MATFFYHKTPKYPNKKPRATLKFYKYDVATACNVCIKTLERWVKKEKVNLKELSLSELVEFIEKHRKDMK